MGNPSVYPCGTTIFDPEKCWNGYTIFPAKDLGAALVDMNGQLVHLWKGLHGIPNKLLPGGYVMGSSGERNPRYGLQDMLDVVQVDWHGNIVWQFNQHEYVEDPGEEPAWMARQHHDFQRAGSPTGYYSPALEPSTENGNTLILSHRNVVRKEISDKTLLDDVILEVDWNGDIVWEWLCSDHFEDMGFTEMAKNVIYKNPNFRPVGGGIGDWMHLNSMSVLGPNPWYEAGDQRFNPENIIWSSRKSNIIAIIEKSSGKLIWRLGPDYDTTPELRNLGWIIGPHHAHMIPQGLPGAGNILIFDNGGRAGYGSATPTSLSGLSNVSRDFSRVLELDPVTLEVKWQYGPSEAGLVVPHNAPGFFSNMVSSAQRLPNGNTMITTGNTGRVIEVTQDHQLVWEYISPYWGTHRQRPTNMIYRAYRVPYDWVPQLPEPAHQPVQQLQTGTWFLPGSPGKEAASITEMTNCKPYYSNSNLCAVEVDEKS